MLLSYGKNSALHMDIEMRGLFAVYGALLQIGGGELGDGKDTGRRLNFSA